MTTPDDGLARLETSRERIDPILIWHDRADEYRRALLPLLPGVPIDTCLRAASPASAQDATVLLTWQPPLGGLRQLPRLSWVHATGAGVDDLLARDDLAPDVVLTRSLGRFGVQTAEYAVGYLLHCLLRIEDYRRNQDRGVWRQLPRPLLADRRVGIIGLGTLGSAIAERLATFGAEIHGVCRGSRPVPNVHRVFDHANWRLMLPGCDALILAMPLTKVTRGMIDADALAALPEGAYLINVARGALIDEEALVNALRAGRLGAAILDVFASEPLPADSPLWTEPRAWVTPHVAAPSEIAPIAAEFAANYQRFIDGADLLHRVERERGY